MSPTADGMVAVGINDAGHFLDGWHEREIEGRTGIAFRATGDAARLRLARVPGCLRLMVLLAGPAALLGHAARGSVAYEGSTAAAVPFEVAGDAFVLRSFPIPDDAGDEFVARVECATVAVPGLAIGNGDMRRMGWAVSAVWQQP